MKAGLSKGAVSNKRGVSMEHTKFMISKTGLTKEMVFQKSIYPSTDKVLQ